MENLFNAVLIVGIVSMALIPFASILGAYLDEKEKKKDS